MLSTSQGATLTFTDIPHDGDTVQFDSHIYEFDNNGSVTSGHVAVIIGNTLQATVDNFKAAVANNYGVV
jgi:hypothetical protein